jgi:hypothetical protein
MKTGVPPGTNCDGRRTPRFKIPDHPTMEGNPSFAPFAKGGRPERLAGGHGLKRIKSIRGCPRSLALGDRGCPSPNAESESMKPVRASRERLHHRRGPVLYQGMTLVVPKAALKKGELWPLPPAPPRTGKCVLPVRNCTANKSTIKNTISITYAATPCQISACRPKAFNSPQPFTSESSILRLRNMRKGASCGLSLEESHPH